MRKPIEALERCLLWSLGVAGAATLVLVVPRSYQLMRQVDTGDLDALQKALVACYSMGIYFLVSLPFTAVASAVIAASTGSRSRGGRSRLRRLAIIGGCAPLACAAAGLYYETRQGRPELREIASRADRGMNVVLIVIDTLRADHVGSYGHARDTTPFLDSLAREGVRFARCHTPAAWTKPSVASILTSLYPESHGANHFGSQLPQGVVTLAEALQQGGFVTYAHVANPNLKAIFDFDQGFDFFDDYLMRDRLYLSALRELPLLSERIQRATGLEFNFRDRENAAAANARILPWLDRYHDRDFFMYLHYMDPHGPYAPPPPYGSLFPPGRGEQGRSLARYDGEIRFVDDQLARLATRFEELGIFDKTLFVVTSDHGEAFGEHGDWLHDHTVYQDQIHVPLILSHKAGLPAGVVVEEAVGSIDIAPTILDLAGLAPPPAMEGRSLRGLALGGAQEPPREIFVDHFSSTEHYRLRSLIADDRWKYILTLRSNLRDIRRLGNEELYDLSADPAEHRNLARRRPRQVAELRERSTELSDRSRAKAEARSSIEELDAATRRQLEELGYLE